MTLRCLTEKPRKSSTPESPGPVTDWDGYDTCYTERYWPCRENTEGYNPLVVLHAVSRSRASSWSCTA